MHVFPPMPTVPDTVVLPPPPAIVQHSSRSNEHYTPLDVLEAARGTLGAFDLDPASTERVNDERVLADRYFTKEDDGLSQPWHGRVFLNPPGGKFVTPEGKKTNQSNAAVWWAKLAGEYVAGRVQAAIFLGFTLEILATSQDAALWIGDFPYCVPRSRLDFDHLVDDAFEPGGAPAHSNIIVYLPPWGSKDGPLAFKSYFKKFGRVCT